MCFMAQALGREDMSPSHGQAAVQAGFFSAVACPRVLSQRESIYPDIPAFSQSPFAALLLMYRQMIS